MNLEHLSISQRGGVFAVAVFALLSALVLAFIAVRTIRFAMISLLKRNSSTSPPPEILFFRTQIGHYAGCLILSNMFISAAGIINFVWASRSGLSPGSTCLAQAVLIQIGIWGASFFTAAHGVHTFISLGLNIRPSRWRSSVSVLLGWILAGSSGKKVWIDKAAAYLGKFWAALAPLRQGNIYGPAGTSCGITSSHPKKIFGLTALPIILGGVVSTTAYSIIFIILYGKLSALNTQKPRDHKVFDQQRNDEFEEYYKFITVIIRTMFWFPLVFIVLMLPFCITHILTYAGYSVPFAWGAFAEACTSMLGLVNVVLLCNTFRVIGPVYRHPHATRACVGTVATLGHNESCEPPIIDISRSASGLPSATQANGCQTYKPILSSPNHSRSSSLDSVGSSTELVGAETGPYEFARTMVPNNATLPEELNYHSGITSSQDNIDTHDTEFHSEIVVAPLRTTSVSSYPVRASFVVVDIQHRPPTQDGIRFSQPSSDTEKMMAKVPTSRSQSQPPSSLSYISIPRTDIASRYSENKRGLKSQPFSLPSKVIQGNDPDYWQEIMYARRIRPLPPIPQSTYHRQDDDGSYPFDWQRMRRSYMSIPTIWSQESGPNQELDIESLDPVNN